VGPHTRTVTYTETLAAAAVKVAASLGVHATDPVILAAYGEDPAQLEVCQQLRKLHLTVWYNLYAERLPHLAPRAAELLPR
jgi:hypothetical protein